MLKYAEFVKAAQVAAPTTPEPTTPRKLTLDTIRDRYRRVKDALKPQGVPAAPQK